MKNFMFSFSNFEKSTKKTFHLMESFLTTLFFKIPLYYKGKSKLRDFNEYTSTGLTP